MVRSEGVRRIVAVTHIVAVFQFLVVFCLAAYDMLTFHTDIGGEVQVVIFSLFVGAVLFGIAWIIKGFNSLQDQS